jgi:hypothetical protein
MTHPQKYFETEFNDGLNGPIGMHINVVTLMCIIFRKTEINYVSLTYCPTKCHQIILKYDACNS